MSGKEEFTTKKERITPTIAREYLNTSLGNPRYAGQDKVSRAAVSLLASDMRAGRWVFTGESTIFDWNGHLIDGHTRLHAVIESGVAIETLVVRGIDPVAARVIDGGWNRTIKQSLMNGFGYDANTASAQMQKGIKIICLARKDSRWVEGHVTRQYYGDFISRYIAEITDTVYLTTPKLLNNGVCKAAFLEAVCAGVDMALLERLKNSVSKGMYEGPAETASVVLRNYLLSDKFPSRGFSYNSLESREAFAIIQTCIKRYIEGTPMQNVPQTRVCALYFTEKNIEERNIEL